MKRSYLKITFLPLAVALASCASLAPNHNPLTGNSPGLVLSPVPSINAG